MGIFTIDDEPNIQVILSEQSIPWRVWSVFHHVHTTRSRASVLYTVTDTCRFIIRNLASSNSRLEHAISYHEQTRKEYRQGTQIIPGGTGHGRTSRSLFNHGALQDSTVRSTNRAISDWQLLQLILKGK